MAVVKEFQAVSYAAADSTGKALDEEVDRRMELDFSTANCKGP
jgi:hypothetical protein